MTDDTHDTTGEVSEGDSDPDDEAKGSRVLPKSTEVDPSLRDESQQGSAGEAVDEERAEDQIADEGGEEDGGQIEDEGNEEDEDQIEDEGDEEDEDQIEDEEKIEDEGDEEDERGEKTGDDDGESAAADSGGGRFGGNVDRYVLWGGLLLSGLLGTVAAVNLYFQVGSVINVWIAGRYQPIFQAGFNLVVLLVAGYVAVRIADRLEVGS